MQRLNKPVAAICLTVASTFVQAQELTYDFNIPAQPAGLVLNALAKQTGLQPFYTEDSVKGVQSPGVKGKYSLREALNRALLGTGLIYQFTAEKAVAIKTASIENVTQLATIEVRDNVEMEVEDNAGNGYAAKHASTATKTDTPLMQTPMTVEVLPKQMLQEMGVVSTGLSDVVKYSGVTTQGLGPSGEMLYFRGFLTSTTLWNGFRIEDFDTNTGLTTGAVWMGNVSSVEMIKGPSSILYGRAEPGGAVNVLTNRPQESSRTTVTAGVGSWSDRWLGIDSTGALNKDKTLLYRLNVAEEESDTWFRWNGTNRSQSIAPALEWRISPQTTLSYEGLYRTLEGYPVNASIPYDMTTGQLVSVDPGKTYMPDGTLQSIRQNRTTLGLAHRFDDDWSMSLKYMHDSSRSPKANYAWPISATFPVTAGVLPVAIAYGWNVYDLTTDATLLDLTGHLSALGIRHTVLLGADYYRKYGNQRGAYDWGSQTTNYFDPAPLDWNIPEQYRTDLTSRDTSVYLQDQMELPGNWHVLLGGRYQRLDQDSANNGVADPHYTKNAFLPRFGLLWQVRPWLSAYYSYSENFGSSNGRRDFTGVLLNPESSKQHELGVKGEWLKGRLNALLAAFELTKTNVAMADTAHPGFSIAAGEVRSTGYELNLQGALTDSWNLLGNYSYARPEITKGIAAYPMDLPAGTLMPMVSNHTFGVWTSYRLTQNWKIGGGYNWASAPTAYPGSPFPTSAYETVSAFASYDTKLGGHKTTVQLNVDNLLDEKYQYAAYDAYGNSGIWSVTWGTPRQIRLGLRTEF
jgi:iron complex outermembrane recepter protein